MKILTIFLAYTSEPKPEAPVVAPGAAVAGAANADSGVSNNVILGVLSLVMMMLVVMLFLVNNMLTKIAGAKGLEFATKRPFNNEHLQSLCKKINF